MTLSMSFALHQGFILGS